MISDKYKLAKLEVAKWSQKIDDGGLTFDEQIEALTMHELALKEYAKVRREYHNYLGINLI